MFANNQVDNKWEVTTEALGWAGVLLVVSAYGLTTFKVFDGGALVTMVMNLLGAICIVIDAFRDKNFQPVVLNIIWGVIAIVGIISYFGA